MNNWIIKRAVLRICALLLIVGLNWTGLLAVGQTISFFSDTDSIAENNISAGSLDVSISPSGAYISSLAYPGDTFSTSVAVSDVGSLAAQYSLKIIPLTSNTDPCNYVNLGATDGTQNYSGQLFSFVSTASGLENPADWNYTFSVDPATPPAVWGKTCYFKWVFDAWGQDVSDPLTGFTDSEQKSGGIRIGKTIVLNEILANPMESDDASLPGGEWVELYNNSSADFDVEGWVLYDSDDSHELHITSANTDSGNTIVPAHGFLVVYRNGDADFTINNGDESVRLYDGYPASSSVLVDSFSWADEKPEGYSFARIPDGTGAWVDPIPTPGHANVLTEETEVEAEEPAEVVVEAQVSQSEEPVITEEAPKEDAVAQEGQQPEEETVVEEETPEEESVVEEPSETVAEEPAVVQDEATPEESLPDEGAQTPEQETEQVIEPEQPAAETQAVLEPVIEQEAVVEPEPVVVPAENPEPAVPPAPEPPAAESGSGEAV